ncbi:MAG TPA: hypothetical protein VJ731_19240 [Terriglobales bacterium]|nr:hypothetical protein [Terriglobales bacterium]
MKHVRLGTTLAAFVLGATLTLATSPKAHADDARSKCEKRVDKAHEHYRHEIAEHGRHSQQADDAKAKLESEWDRCYTEAHGWYDPNHREWRTDRDWDRSYDWDHDRDRDRDHDHDHDHN